MNKYFLSAIVVITLIIYSFRVHTEPKDTIPKVIGTPPSDSNKTTYKDGIYKGDVTDAMYGNVEIQAIIKNSELSEVAFLQYPNHHEYSKVINTESLPKLATEAIASQNAEVDIYSGATQTSKAFQKSLRAALEKAKI